MTGSSSTQRLSRSPMPFQDPPPSSKATPWIMMIVGLLAVAGGLVAIFLAKHYMLDKGIAPSTGLHNYAWTPAAMGIMTAGIVGLFGGALVFALGLVKKHEQDKQNSRDWLPV